MLLVFFFKSPLPLIIIVSVNNHFIFKEGEREGTPEKNKLYIVKKNGVK